MIDELSLGLAPVIVEQLLDIVRAIRDQGTTIILVEQSVNVALTVAETAYFMEKGEIRFKGPTAELLERPDMLRSVFLEGAGAAVGQTTPSGQRHQRPHAHAEARRRAAARRRRRRTAESADARPARGRRAVDQGASAASARSDDVSLRRSAQGEILGFIGPNGAGKTTLFDLISGFVAPDAGRVVLDGIDVTDAGARRPGPPRPGPLVPGRPPVPVAHRARDDRARARAPARRARPVAAALHLPAVAEPSARVAAAGRRAGRADGPRAPSPTSSSASCRPAAGASSTSPASLAHEPDGDPLRRAVVGHRPARDRGARPAAPARIRDATGASLLVIEHDMPLITAISDRLVALDLGTVIDRRARPAEVLNHPHGRSRPTSAPTTNVIALGHPDADGTEPMDPPTPVHTAHQAATLASQAAVAMRELDRPSCWAIGQGLARYRPFIAVDRRRSSSSRSAGHAERPSTATTAPRSSDAGDAVPRATPAALDRRPTVTDGTAGAASTGDGRDATGPAPSASGRGRTGRTPAQRQRRSGCRRRRPPTATRRPAASRCRRLRPAVRAAPSAATTAAPPTRA